MVWPIVVVLFLLWLTGMISAYTLDGFIHILLVVALAAVLVHVLQRRPAV